MSGGSAIMFYLDSYYVILVLPTMLLSLLAQLWVQSTFKKYSSYQTSRGISGKEIAEKLLVASNIQGVRIEELQGSLTDHYDPSHKVLRLSQSVYAQRSVAAVGVAAHETGHALQDKVGYPPLILRSTLVPVANIGASFGPTMAFAGLFFGMELLINVGIILFSVAVAFYLITLPVEIDASRRALKMLKETGTLTSSELSGIRSVLTAAAFTYVASALTAIASLARLILLANSRKRR